MPDTFTVDVPGDWIPDGAGGGYSVPAEGQSYPCRKLSSAESEQLIGGQMLLAGQAVLALPLGSPLNANTVGTYASTETGEVARYAVKAPRTSTYSPHLLLVVAPEGSQGAG